MATIDAADGQNTAHYCGYACQKSLEEANAVLAKKDVSLTDRFNTVSIAIERVQRPSP